MGTQWGNNCSATNLDNITGIEPRMGENNNWGSHSNTNNRLFGCQNDTWTAGDNHFYHEMIWDNGVYTYTLYDNADYTTVITTAVISSGSNTHWRNGTPNDDFRYIVFGSGADNGGGTYFMDLDNIQIWKDSATATGDPDIHLEFESQGTGTVTEYGNDGDWAHSDSAHTLTVSTDYVAEITRGNIGAGADTAFVDYDNPITSSGDGIWEHSGVTTVLPLTLIILLE